MKDCLRIQGKCQVPCHDLVDSHERRFGRWRKGLTIMLQLRSCLADLDEHGQPAIFGAGSIAEGTVRDDDACGDGR